MVDLTSPFNLHSLVNNPNFNFINSLNQSDSDDDIIQLTGDFTDSPYKHSTFTSSYIDTPSLLNTIKNSNKLSILSLNIQSLSAKYNNFRDLILEFGSADCFPDIICLQEIWTVMDASLFPLPGYQQITMKTRNKGQGGGLASMSGQVFPLSSTLPNQSLLKNSLSLFLLILP